MVDARVHADGTALFHVRKSGLSDEEMRVDVDVEGVEPLVSRDVGKLLFDVLSAVVEHESVDRAELVYMRLDELVAVVLFGKIQCDGVESDFGSAFPDEGEGALNVLFFLFQIV